MAISSEAGRSSNHNTDILIVGGGPAGTSAAISLRQNSPFDVTLIDKADFPRDKPCGDGLSPGIVHLAKELGAEDAFEQHTVCDSYTIVGPNSREISGEITGQGGYVIPRKNFDAFLLDKARQCGVKVLTQHSFKSLEQTDDSVLSTVAKPSSIPQDDNLLIRSRIVIGADGANSRVRASLGARTTSKRRTGIAMRAYAKFSPQSKCDLSRLWIVFHQDLLPAYAWLFPIGNSGADVPSDIASANIGIGCLVHDNETSRAWFLRHLENFVEQLEQHGIYLGDISDEKTYLLPHGGKIPKLAHGRVALIGDAASMINPLSGEGIFYGMSAGHMLAQTLFAETTHSARNEKAALKQWERAVRQRFAKHLRHNFLAHRLMRHPSWANTLTRAMATDTELADKAIDLMFREGTLSAASFTRVVRKAVTAPRSPASATSPASARPQT